MDIYVMTIQWRNWERTVEGFYTQEKAAQRLTQIALEEYPDEDGDPDLFAEHGHNWYIDAISVEKSA